MGIIKAFSGSISGTFADQWKDIITVNTFDELTVLQPGILKQSSRATFNYGTPGIISNGSKILVPENTAAVIFNQSGIEEIITEAGGYEYNTGAKSIFSGDGFGKSIFREVGNRFSFGGNTDEYRIISFINLREIRGIRFGTKGPIMYHDLRYGVDLEIMTFGMFSIKVVNVETFVRNFLPANVNRYSFSDAKARTQLLSEFIQSLNIAINSLSSKYRISELPSKANEIVNCISEDQLNAGGWEERFGFRIVNVGIENIEYSETSRELVNKFSSSKMEWKVFDDVSQKTSNISAQQKIAQGVQNHGLGDMPGMALGMGLIQDVIPSATKDQKPEMSFDDQIATVMKLKELLDNDIITKEEFEIKKKEVMDL